MNIHQHGELRNASYSYKIRYEDDMIPISESRVQLISLHIRIYLWIHVYNELLGYITTF